MTRWEEIAFAIALAAFGWLLYKTNMQTNAGIAADNSGSVNMSTVPFFLNFNQSAGFTGPIANSPRVIDGGVATPNVVLGLDNSNTCPSCSVFPQVQF